MAGENAKVHQAQTPDQLTVESGGDIQVKSGGTITVKSGGVVNIETGGILKANGTQASAINDLTASGSGTANDAVQAISALTATATVTALRDEFNAGTKPQLDNNFEDIRAKINAILAALRGAGIIA